MRSRWTFILVVLVVSACSSTPPRGGGYYQDDGPQSSVPVDVWQVPEPTPKHEARSNYGNKPYTVFNKTYTPLKDARGYRERGIASWYGKKYHGKRTSSGEPYDMYALSAAHTTLPLPSYARVRNLSNNRSVVVRVNDRGPFLDNRLIDLSYTAAARLGIIGTGTGLVEVEGLSPDEPVPKEVRTTHEPPAAGHTAETAAKLYVQAGAFTHLDNARALRTRLEKSALQPIEIQSTQLEHQIVHRVRIGPLTSVEESDRVAARVAVLGIDNAYVIVE